MADHEATVEVSTGGSTFKISGSEKFVEKMIGVLPAAFPETPLEHRSGEGAKGKKHHDNGKTESLDDFVTRVKVTNELSGPKKVAAFVVYLTEIRKQATCSAAEIEECFDKTGLRTPENLSTVINNATKSSVGGYIRSVQRGQYAPTTNGKNLVKTLAKDS